MVIAIYAMIYTNFFYTFHVKFISLTFDTIHKQPYGDLTFKVVERLKV